MRLSAAVLLRLVPVAGAVACLAIGITAAGAQGGHGEDFQGLKISAPPNRPVLTPFPLDVHTPRVGTLPFRAPETMTAADRALADGAQAEIARRAELAGLHLEESGWGYEQAVCPSFPGHLILEYSRLEPDGQPGNASLFSVAVPRGGEGHVRVIPLRRRGYSLWTPASTNELTLNDFNHMVKESSLSEDWLNVSLCYAALAGGHVRAALIPRSPAEEAYPLAMPPMLTVSSKGGAEIRVADAGHEERRGEWIFEYAQSGVLKKVKRVYSKELHEVVVAGNVMEVQGVPTAEQPPPPKN